MSASSNPAAWRGRKRLFLHVGTHKTGTTSIQVALTRARALLDVRGILFPRAGAPASDPYGQHLLAWSVIRRPNYLPAFDPGPEGFGEEAKARLWRRLREEIDASEAHTAIVSSEEFDVLTHEEVLAVGRELVNYDVTPVIYLRNLADLLESSYRTSVVYGAMPREFEDYIANQRIRLDYAKFVSEWREIAVHGEVVIVFYDDPGIRRGAVQSFFRLIGIDPAQLDALTLASLNESVPAFVCEIMRFMRQKGCAEAQVANWLKNIRSAPFPATVNSDYSFMSPETRVALDRRYDDELALLGAMDGFAGMARGESAYAHREPAPVTISNVAVALLALGQALAAGAESEGDAGAPA